MFLLILFQSMLLCSFFWAALLLLSNVSALLSPIKERHSKPNQMSKMELFAKMINSHEPLMIFTKSHILKVLLGSEYTSD